VRVKKVLDVVNEPDNPVANPKGLITVAAGSVGAGGNIQRQNEREQSKSWGFG